MQFKTFGYISALTLLLGACAHSSSKTQEAAAAAHEAKSEAAHGAEHAASTAEGYATAELDIVDTAIGAGSFNTLVAALKAADLVETLKGAGPFTVFAPSDEAFAKLPAGTIDTLLQPDSKGKLAAILTYHVVAGRVTAAQAMELSSAKTVQGSELKLSVNAGSVMVDDARVTKADIPCSNGIIHVIDSVVMPAS